jgi:Flp pilus assembly protein TadG
MSLSFTSLRTAYATVRSTLAAFAADQRGNIAVITALSLPVLLGGTGLGVEVSYWYYTQRNMQHAADSAVVAAATNATSSYEAEAKAIAAAYGFKHGQNNVSVVASKTAPCPSPGAGSNCYSVTITGSVPLFLSQVVGYSGTTVMKDGKPTGARQTVLSATAIADQEPLPREYCLLALGTSNEAITLNGAPNANLSGCNVMSNGGAVCHGHDSGADHGDAAGTNDPKNPCGKTQRSKVSPVADPYAKVWNASTDALLKTSTCGGKFLGTSWSGGKILPAITHICGDLTLTDNVVINTTPPDGAVVVIWNGSLDTGTYKLQTASGTGLTIIFAGDNSATYKHTITGSGELDIAAPTSGPWAGVAIYQAPNLTVGVDIENKGQGKKNVEWKITGLVYMPNADLTFSGAAGKSTYGKACFGLVVKTILINGGGSSLNRSECPLAGLELPSGPGVGGRGRLAG